MTSHLNVPPSCAQSTLSQRAVQWLSIVLAVFMFSAGTLPIAQAAEPNAVPVRAQSVNVNQATVQELAAALDGVGEGKAQAIVDHREANGAFASLEQLTDVKGIGEATLAKNKDRLTL